jgi:hypothetical protein
MSRSSVLMLSAALGALAAVGPARSLRAQATPAPSVPAATAPSAVPADVQDSLKRAFHAAYLRADWNAMLALLDPDEVRTTAEHLRSLPLTEGARGALFGDASASFWQQGPADSLARRFWERVPRRPEAYEPARLEVVPGRGTPRLRVPAALRAFLTGLSDALAQRGA